MDIKNNQKINLNFQHINLIVQHIFVQYAIKIYMYILFKRGQVMKPRQNLIYVVIQIVQSLINL